jgi:hypothetical protein
LTADESFSNKVFVMMVFQRARACHSQKTKETADELQHEA